MAEEKEAIGNEDEGITPKKSFFKWILLTGIVLFVVIGGYFGWTLFVKGGEGVAGISEPLLKLREEKPVIYPLNPFIVNLMDKSGLGKRYLKVTMKLEVGNEKDKDLLADHTPQIRDTVLLLLSSLTFKDINSIEGKIDLKQSLMARINRVLGDGRVRTIYFSEFVVQ
jgi:flagellar FliL protein